MPILQDPRGVAWFWKKHRGHDFASSALMGPMTDRFVRRINEFAQREGIDLITFRKGQRKDDIAQEYRAHFEAEEGVLFVGKAQEKAAVVRTERRRNPKTGGSYAWLVKTTSFLNYYYFYVVDRDFGPLFIKFCSYFPYNGKVCLNGHEYLKRQLEKAGISFEPLDNGVLWYADPKRAQQLAAELSPEKIDAIVRKLFRKLASP